MNRSWAVAAYLYYTASKISDGFIIIPTALYGTNYGYALTIQKLDTAGHQQWSYAYVPKDETGKVVRLKNYSLAELPDGYLVTSNGAFFEDVNNKAWLCLMKIDKSGAVKWMKIYNLDPGSEHIPFEPVITTDGYGIISITNGYSTINNIILKIDPADGNVLWAERINVSSYGTYGRFPFLAPLRIGNGFAAAGDTHTSDGFLKVAVFNSDGAVGDCDNFRIEKINYEEASVSSYERIAGADISYCPTFDLLASTADLLYQSGAIIRRELCQGMTTPDSQCGSSGLNNCNDSSSCSAAGGYWYGDSCHDSPESPADTDTTGQPIIISDLEDSFVDETTPENAGRNFGDAEQMTASPVSNCNNANDIIFIKFDLDHAPGNVEKVELVVEHLPQTTACHSNCNADFYFYPVLEPWDEMTLTFNNKPEYDDTPVYGPVNITVPNDFGQRRYDITDVYRRWMDGNLTNYGLAIHSPTVGCNNAAAQFMIYSSENTGHTGPYLEITPAGDESGGAENDQDEDGGNQEITETLAAGPGGECQNVSIDSTRPTDLHLAFIAKPEDLDSLVDFYLILELGGAWYSWDSSGWLVSGVVPQLHGYLPGSEVELLNMQNMDLSALAGNSFTIYSGYVVLENGFPRVMYDCRTFEVQ